MVSNTISFIFPFPDFLVPGFLDGLFPGSWFLAPGCIPPWFLDWIPDSRFPNLTDLF